MTIFPSWGFAAPKYIQLPQVGETGSLILKKPQYYTGFGWGFLFAVLLGGGEGRDYFAEHTTLKFARGTHVLGELPRNPD